MDVEIMVPFKYLNHVWGTLKTPLINCKTNLILTWSANRVIAVRTVKNQATAFPVTDTKLYVPVVTLSTDDNVKLLQQLESGFKARINWNEYQSKVKIQEQN